MTYFPSPGIGVWPITSIWKDQKFKVIFTSEFKTSLITKDKARDKAQQIKAM